MIGFVCLSDCALGMPAFGLFCFICPVVLRVCFVYPVVLWITVKGHSHGGCPRGSNREKKKASAGSVIQHSKTTSWIGDPTLEKQPLGVTQRES